MNKPVNYCININSKDRTNQQDDTNKPTFIIRDLINERQYKKTYLTMTYAVFPPTIYNITSGNGSQIANNNTVVVVENTVPATVALTFTVTVPNGNYNIASFITAFTTALTAQSAISGYANTYTGTYNGTTGQLTISIVGLPANRSFTYSFTTLQTSLMQFLGFNSTWNNLTFAPPSNTITSPQPVNFVYPASLYVRCSVWKNNTCYDTSDNNGSGNILAIIPIESNGLSQVVYEEGYEGVGHKKIEIENLLNTQLQFFVTDEYNNLINLNGYDWQAQLIFELQK